MHPGGATRLFRILPALLALCLSIAAAASCRPAAAAELPASGRPAAGRPAEVADPRAAATAALESRAAAIAAGLSDEDLVGQTLIIGVEGVKSLSNGSRAVVQTVRPGAVILFGFNVSEDPRAVASLTADLRAALNPERPSNDGGGAALPPFVAIDHEGGSVYRFKGGLTRLPSARTMGRAGPEAARAAGAASGSELRALGVTMNAAPVVEALTEDNRAFLVDRVWSDDPGGAGALGAAFIAACQSGGAAAVAKHFPGNAAADPHRSLPVLPAPMSAMEDVYLPPFREAIAAGVSAIMLSHVLVPAIDPDLPVSVSGAAVTLLKRGLGFRGIVMTDDLQMAALSEMGGPGPAAIAALSAGADMLMVSGGRAALDVRAALLRAMEEGRLPRRRVEDAAARVIAQKLRYGLDAETRADREARLAALDDTVERNRDALARALSSDN